MLEVIKLAEKRESLVKLINRGPDTPESEVEAAFNTLGVGDFRDCGVFLGSFDGNAGWERHLKGDELVHVLGGEAEFDYITDDKRETVTLSEGLLIVVPKGCWHRFSSTDGITVLTATPRHDEEHTFVDDPREL